MNRVINIATMVVAAGTAAVAVDGNQLAAAGWFVVALKCLQLELTRLQ